MPLSHFSKVFAIADMKFYKMTADNPGSATSYATSIDVPGAKRMRVSGTVETKTLRGDNMPLDADSVLQDVKVEAEAAKWHLDILAAMLGLTVTDTGTTPAQIATLSMTGATPINFGKFKLASASASSDAVGGNATFTLAKCVLSKFPDIGMVEEDYVTMAWEAQVFPCLGTGQKWLDLAFNETAVVLT